jgi:hypothetical protein
VKRRPRIRGQVHAWIGILCGGFCALAWGTCGIFLLVALVSER